MEPRWIILAAIVGLLCKYAQGISCIGTYDTRRKMYIYRVSQVTGVNVSQANSCEFSWNNMTNGVLANQNGKDKRVGYYNVTTLELREHMDLFYWCSCISEDVKLEVNCTLDSFANAESRGREELRTSSAPPTTALPTPSNHHNHWGVLAAFLLVLVLMLLGGLAYKRRSKSEAGVADKDTAQCGCTGCKMWRGGEKVGSNSGYSAPH